MGSTTSLHPHTYFTKKSVARKEGNAMIDKIIMLLLAFAIVVIALKVKL